MEEAAEQIAVNDAKQAAAFEHWFALNEERRQDGKAGSAKQKGWCPGHLVDPDHRRGGGDRLGRPFRGSCGAAVTQAAMVAAVAIIVVSGLVLVRFLDKPYEGKSGSIQPTAMERTLAQMEREHRERGQAVIRCADFAG
jgi:hypothetical protein